MPEYTIEERCIIYRTYYVTADTPEAAKALFDDYTNNTDAIQMDSDITWGDTYDFAFMHDEHGHPCLEEEYL